MKGYCQALKFSFIIVREFYSPPGCNKTERVAGIPLVFVNPLVGLLRPAL
jgi:hypothetical protein